MVRTFISIDLPENIKKEIQRIQDLLPDFVGKKTEQENLHLTLKFLGEIDNEKVEEIKKRLKLVKIKAFEAEVDNLGVFSEKFVRIVWIHLKGAEKLQEEVDKALKEIFDKEERFMSHITIARVKSIKNKMDFLSKLKEIKIPKLKFKVDSFQFKKSELFPQGPRYEVIEGYNLG